MHVAPSDVTSNDQRPGLAALARGADGRSPGLATSGTLTSLESSVNRGVKLRILPGWLVLIVTAGTSVPVVTAGETEPVVLPPVEVRAWYPLVPARYRSTPRPAYPEDARQEALEGTALLAVQVLTDGRVGDVSVKTSSGSTLLDDAAVRAVKRWTFDPARRGPRAVDSLVDVPISFRRP
jgi:TonB family protein